MRPLLAVFYFSSLALAVDDPSIIGYYIDGDKSTTIPIPDSYFLSSAVRPLLTIRLQPSRQNVLARVQASAQEGEQADVCTSH